MSEFLFRHKLRDQFRKETGSKEYEHIAKYADWLESKIKEHANEINIVAEGWQKKGLTGVATRVRDWAQRLI